MKKFFVGRNDQNHLSAEESGIGRQCKKRSFVNYEKAVAFIDSLNPIQVRNGEFYLDAPEESMNGMNISLTGLEDV